MIAPYVSFHHSNPAVRPPIGLAEPLAEGQLTVRPPIFVADAPLCLCASEPLPLFSITH